MVFTADPGAAQEADEVRRSTGAMITGIVFTGLAGVNGVGAIYYGVREPDGGDLNIDKGLAVVFGVGAGVCAAIGIPLLIYGAPKVPASEVSLQLGPSGLQGRLRF